MGAKDLKENVWYKAIGVYDDEEWLNIFLEISRDNIRYLSIGPLSSEDIYFTELVDEPYAEFKDNILDNFEFEKIPVPSGEDTKAIIKGILK